MSFPASPRRPSRALHWFVTAARNLADCNFIFVDGGGFWSGSGLL